MYDAKGDVLQFLRQGLTARPERPLTSKTVTTRELFKRLEGTAHAGVRSRNPWALFNGDAKACLEMLPDRSVDCVVTSPPYYWQRDYEVEGQSGHEATV